MGGSWLEQSDRCAYCARGGIHGKIRDSLTRDPGSSARATRVQHPAAGAPRRGQAALRGRVLLGLGVLGRRRMRLLEIVRDIAFFREWRGTAPLLLPTFHRAPQVAIKIGMRIFEVTDDFEVDTLDLRKIDLFYMNKTQQLFDRPGHFASAFVTRSAALCYADLRPELLLIQSQAASNFTRIEDAIEKFHGSSMFLLER